MTENVKAALELIALGWPIMVAKPRSKEPLTPHGVRDATTDAGTVTRWLKRWPDANLAVATGAPGPQVLDVDNPTAAGHVLPLLQRIVAPKVATQRAWHTYFRGTTQGTVSLGFGELRGQGSYVLVPPSIHPTGKQYIWLESPLVALPPVPDIIAGTRQTAGTGEFDAPELIPKGARHDALKDAAVRFLRGGFTDPTTLEQMLKAFFHARCDPNPPPKRNEFRDIAKWAANSDIAAREREAQLEPEKPPKKRKKTDLDAPPSGDAPLAEHRAYVRHAGGWSDRIDIKNVRRYGNRGVDALEIQLTNGQRIYFDAQDQITKRSYWARVVTGYTNGIADPRTLTDWQAQKVFRSLCILADAPTDAREADELEEILDDLTALTERITDHDLSTPEGRYEATIRCWARGAWDPRQRDPDKQPVMLLDRDGTRYLRAGEVRDYLAYRGLGVSAGALRGRMGMIGVRHVVLNGREAQRPDREARRTSHIRLYQLPEQT